MSMNLDLLWSSHTRPFSCALHERRWRQDIGNGTMAEL